MNYLEFHYDTDILERQVMICNKNILIRVKNEFFVEKTKIRKK
jgi:hypothetical protein